jgi:hypothetical protein
MVIIRRPLGEGLRTAVEAPQRDRNGLASLYGCTQPIGKGLNFLGLFEPIAIAKEFVRSAHRRWHAD